MSATSSAGPERASGRRGHGVGHFPGGHRASRPHVACMSSPAVSRTRLRLPDHRVLRDLDLHIEIGGATVSATSMVARRLHRHLRAPCCRTRPQRRPFNPGGAMYQAWPKRRVYPRVQRERRREGHRWCWSACWPPPRSEGISNGQRTGPTTVIPGESAKSQGRQERRQVDAAVVPQVQPNAVRLQLHALAYNLANVMRTLALPKQVEHWSLTTIREKLVKIGAKVVAHGRYVTFQMAEVAVPRDLFRDILRRIDRLRRPVPAMT